jgi:glycosyltransferase involved in cell wall biosynthesis
MYVTRAALDDCGLLDEATFGLGYGEEVDFCVRATRIGYRHVVDDQTFVYHRGGGSFGTEREERLARGSALIRHRYPFFRPTNRRERRHDPMAPVFASLELGLSERRLDRPHVLHVLHSAPEALGGTEKHLHALLKSLETDMDFSILHPVTSGFVLRTMWMTDDGRHIEHEFLLPGGARWATRVRDENAAAALRTALDMFSFDAVHLQNLINHSLAPLEVLAGFPGPVVCSVRDLFLACPNHSLLYRGHACGIPADLAYCDTCLPETKHLPLAYLENFRSEAARHLATVDSWVFASQSACDYLLRVHDLPESRVHIIEHGALVDLSNRTRSIDDTLVFHEPLRVAFVGLGRAKKGLAAVSWLAEALAGTTIQIHHFGELGELASGHVHLHGVYDNAILAELLDAAGIQVVLLPGAYAETFGHVMTEALAAGRPVIGAHYGALGERIRRTGAGWTIDPADPTSMLELLQDLDRCRTELRRGTEAAARSPIRSVAGTADAYRQLYQPGGRR